MTKQELQELRHAQEYINTRKKEIELLKQDITYIKGIDYSKDKTGTAQTTQEDLICNMLNLELDLMKQTKELMKRKDEAKEKIFKLEDEIYQLILYKRYILCESWNKIAKDINYSERKTFYLHGEALLEINKVCSPVQ